MLYLIGLGLSLQGISAKGLEIAKRCKRVYLENYTVDFPYPAEQLEEFLGKKIIPADRDKVEGFEIIDEAKKRDVALLVYGSPLTATTHISLIHESKKSRVKCRVIYSASVLDAIPRTGLQIYKFGKIASMPAWKKSFEPTSFMEIVKNNQKINAHSLILIDIGLGLQDALEQLIESAKKEEVKIKKVLVCSHLGTNKPKILYEDIEDLRNYRGIQRPYCLIIPSKLHFLEKEILEDFKK